MKMLSGIHIDEILKDKTKLRNLINTLIECFFLFVICAVSYRLQIGLTTFNIEPDYTFWRRLYKLTLIATIFKIAMGYKNKTLWLSIPVAAVFYFAFPYEHYILQAFYAPLIVGCVGVKVRKIFWAAGVPAILVIVNMMIASLGGAIESMATAGENMSSYWGHISPTDFGTAVFCNVLFIWIMFKDMPDIIELIIALFSVYISFVISRCNTSQCLTVLLLVILAGRIIYKLLSEKKKIINWISKLIDAAMVIAFPALGLLTLVMVLAYYKELPYTRELNLLFHHRLAPAAEMLSEYGIRPFGTYFDMAGWGGSVVSNIKRYTFIDSSYPQIIIRYGWVTYVFANLMWSYTTWKAIKTDNRKIAYAMSLLAVDFVMEHHWYELSYNVFLIIPFARFMYDESIRLSFISEFKDRCKDRKYAATFMTAVTAVIMMCYALLPIGFSWLRTIVNGYGIYGGEPRGVKLFWALTIIVFVVGILIYDFGRLVADLATIRKFGLCELLLFGISIALLIGGICLGSFLIDRVQQRNAERIDSEKEILELISSNTASNLYVDKLPEAYIRRLGGIGRSFYNGEDYARYSEATVVTDASWDSQCLIGRGFLYLQISDEDAVYTNDQRMISVLKHAGYKLKGYNSYEYTIDLETLAEMNDVEILDDGVLELEGTKHQLTHCPYVSLNPGTYTAKYELRLPEKVEKDVKVCSLRITAFSGENTISDIDIYGKEFDEKGHLTYELPFNGYGNNCEFLVNTEDGVKCEVSYISYRRTPSYDTHRYIDKKGRTVKEEYYDINGKPIETAENVYGVEYEYDGKDRAKVIRYLGRDMKPAIISEGFAEVHREFDLKNQIIEESYYGVQGEPVERADGYHLVRRDFDNGGNIIQESFYDLSDKSVMVSESYAKYIRTFDDKNRWIRTEFYGTDDKLVLQEGNFAIVEREYDEKGNVTSESYKGINGEPVLYYGLYYENRRKFKEDNRYIHEEYYDTERKRISIYSGYFGLDREYDGAGNLIKLVYLGEDMKPIELPEGYAICRKSYNDKNQVIREEYYDADDKPVLISDTYASVSYTYDEDNKHIKSTYLDASGKVVEEKLIE